MTRRRRGHTLVELLVGLAVALCVLAGAGALAVGQATHARRTTDAMQLQQDLRAAMDIVARELRRSGHDGAAQRLVRTDALAPSAVPPPAYLAAQAEREAAIDLSYSHDRDRGDAENEHLDSDEHGGFRLDASSGALQVRLGDGGFQDLTDPQAIKVTSFHVWQQDDPLTLACTAAAGCPASSDCHQVVRLLHVHLEAQARHDATMQRTLDTSVRLRNDRLECAS